MPGLVAPTSPIGFFFQAASFGSNISPAQSGPGGFYALILQPGTYQVHWSAEAIQLPAGVPAAVMATTLNQFLTAQWFTQGDAVVNGQTSMSGDHLISVSAPNSTLQFVVVNLNATFNRGCRIVITQLR
jgi:hypothetical protein